MRNQLIILGALTVVLLGVAGVTIRQMGIALEERLIERARAEARWEAERQRRGEDLGMPPSCTSGHIESGVLPTRASLGRFDDAPGFSAVVAEGLADPRSEESGGIALRWAGAPLIVASAPMEAGTAWAAIAVADPPKMNIWRVVGAFVFLLAMAVIAGALRMGWQLRRDVDGMARTLRALADDLNAPIASSRAEEIRALGDGVSELASRLRDTRGREQELQTELTTQRRLASLGRVAAGLAHEVRNPLAAIKIRVDLLREQEPGGHKAVLLGAVADEVERLDAVVDDLLTFARTGESRSEVELGELVCKRVEASSPWAKHEHVEVSCRCEHVMASLDARGLERVIDNLVRNAVEATPRGGKVDVVVGVEDGQIIVDVLDDGPGVLAEIVDDLFEPFVTTKDTGTGLGLALSRTIVEAHGGALSYRRVAGRSAFRLSLPGEAAKSAAAA